MKRSCLQLLILFLIVITACTRPASQNDENDTQINSSRQELLTQANKWSFQLQDVKPEEIAKSDYDLIVIDYSKDGSDGNTYTRAEIDAMKGDGTTRKLLLAYLSIGEAEDYRFYFNQIKPYLDDENAQWEGNYKVRYWLKGWKDILKEYLDRILKAGFDGVYLDIIDAYEYFEPGGSAKLERDSAANDMVSLVAELANYARETNPDFLIVPQNATNIINDASNVQTYLNVIDAIGSEDTFFFGDKAENNDLNIQYSVVKNLKSFQDEGKPVLLLDYVTHPAKISIFHKLAHENGFMPHSTVRALDVLSTNEESD